MPEKEIWKFNSIAACANSMLSVKQCITPPTSSARSSRMIAQGIRGGGAGVNDQGLGALARRANMRAKARPLPLHVTALAIIIQAGFADGDDFRVLRALDQIS